MDITQKKKNRFLFLQKIYEDGNGSTNAVFNMYEVGKELNFDRNETSNIVSYLMSEDLLESYSLGGFVIISHWGIKEVEEVLENPNQPTQHFLPLNIISIGTMTNSSLQQGTNASTININLDSIKLNDIAHILESLKNVQDVLDLSVDLHKELISEMQTLQIQKESPKPKSLIINESLKTIRSLLESVSSNVIAAPIIEQITKLIHNGL